MGTPETTLLYMSTQAALFALSSQDDLGAQSETVDAGEAGIRTRQSREFSRPCDPTMRRYVHSKAASGGEFGERGYM